MTTQEARTTPGTHYVVIPFRGMSYTGDCDLTMPVDSTHARELAAEFMADLGIVSLQVYTCGYPINERFHVSGEARPGTTTERPAYGR